MEEILLNRIYMYEPVRQIWEEERIPEEWKETIIVPIYKKGDTDRRENYKGNHSFIHSTGICTV